MFYKAAFRHDAEGAGVFGPHADSRGVALDAAEFVSAIAIAGAKPDCAVRVCECDELLRALWTRPWGELDLLATIKEFDDECQGA